MPKEDNPVIGEFNERVARITLNRPAKRNPLDWATVREIAALIERIEKDPIVQVAVIRGSGGHFSAGGDLVGYMELYRRPDDFRQFLADFHAMLNVMEASRKIYIALVEGYCVAGGLELLLACDLVLASASAKIGDAHLKFGQLPGAGGSQRLIRTVGPMRARHLMLTGAILEAAEAEKMGLVSRVVVQESLASESNELIDRLLAASPLGLAGMKHLAYSGMRLPVDEALRMELDYVARYATTTSDALEGLKAFQEKRKPRFTGA